MSVMIDAVAVGEVSLPEGWELVTLKDAGVTLIDCDHKTPKESKNGLPYVTIPQLKDGRIDLSASRLISEEDFRHWTRKANPLAHDVILSRRCNPGETAYVSPGMKFALGQNMVILRSDGNKIFSPFLRWLVRTPFWREQVSRFINVGAVFNSLKCADIPNFRLPLPPFDQQVEMDALLSVLDSRILLLRETNATLEAIAQALFKSWFVDFDPVRAKAEGREPEGVPPEVVDLFPDELVESELGMIPKGWDVGVLSDLIVLQRGFDLPSHSRSPGSIPVIAASGLNGFHNEYMVKAPGVVTGRSGILGKVFLELRDFWPLNTTLWVKEFNRATPCYAFHFLQTIDLHTFNAGSAVPTLNRNHIHGLKSICPPKKLVEQYEERAMLLHTAANQNETRAETLTDLRDTLLPRLMSGKLRIADAEKDLDAI